MKSPSVPPAPWAESFRVDRRQADRMHTGFEIDLFEGILRVDRNHLGALHGLGCACTRAGEHERALAADERFTALCPDNPVAHYNRACSLANLRRIEEALGALERAVTLGYRDFRHIDHDPDLANVRRDPRYHKMLLRLRKSRSG